tara:strand:- start:633 stop:911 length:279 start_codon:yes stop_codon:yes gene_type:complete
MTGDKKFDDTNRGALFKNDYKEQGDNKPDLTGKLNVEGKSYRIAAWEKTSDAGKNYLSLQLTDPEVQQKNLQSEPQLVSKPKPETKDDDLPF